MPAPPSVLSAEVPKSNKKTWRDDAVKDSTSQGPNAAARQNKQKPDVVAHEKAVEEISKEIEGLRAVVNQLRDQIPPRKGKDTAEPDERQGLRKRLDEIRKLQADAKQARAGTWKKFDEVKTALTRKTADLKSLKDKAPFKSVADVDSKISKHEKDIESGTLKLIDEKRVVTEISNLKKMRKTVESFQSRQNAIDEDKKALDEIRKQLDDPESKKLSEEFTQIQDRITELSKANNAEYAARSVLIDKRNKAQAEVDAAYNRRRAIQSAHRIAMNEWYKAAQEERDRKQAAYKKQADEAATAKRAAAAAAEREAAEFPAFTDEIGQCNAAITYLESFSGRPSAAAEAKPTDATVSALPEVAEALKGTKQPQAFLLKKKGDDEEEYFMGGSKSRKNKKSMAPKEAPSKKFKLPLSVVDFLWKIKVEAPATAADVPKAIEAIKEKRTWYEKESPKATAANKAKAEAKIAALANAKTETADDDVLVAASSPSKGKKAVDTATTKKPASPSKASKSDESANAAEKTAAADEGA